MPVNKPARQVRKNWNVGNLPLYQRRALVRAKHLPSCAGLSMSYRFWSLIAHSPSDGSRVGQVVDLPSLTRYPTFDTPATQRRMVNAGQPPALLAFRFLLFPLRRIHRVISLRNNANDAEAALHRSCRSFELKCPREI